MTPSIMVRRLPLLTPSAKVKYLTVSLPRIEALIDNERYFSPDDPLPPPAGEELQKLQASNISQTAPASAQPWKIWWTAAAAAGPKSGG